MSERGVAVVIVAHDSGDLLVDCVARVAAAEGVREIAIVDNGSRDGAPARAVDVAGAIGVRLVRNEANPGFAVACNQGAAVTGAPWLVFLNPDCLVERDTIARLVAVGESDLSIGLVGADVRDPEGRREAAARRVDPDLRVAARRALGRANGESSATMVAPAGDVSDVDATSGALMLVRRALFIAIGGFDEAYRLHCEDLDLCRRIRAAGARVVVAERVPVVHLKGTSSRARPWFVLWQKHRGMLRYYRKFDAKTHGWPARAFVTLGWAGYTALAFLRLAIKRATQRG